MLLVMEINSPAQMGNAYQVLGGVTVKMTVVTNRMKTVQVVLVRKSIITTD